MATSRSQMCMGSKPTHPMENIILSPVAMQY